MQFLYFVVVYDHHPWFLWSETDGGSSPAIAATFRFGQLMTVLVGALMATWSIFLGGHPTGRAE